MILETVFSKRDRVDPIHPKDPALAKIFGLGENTSAGVAMDSDLAMNLSAVYACVRILSSVIAMLPLELYKRTGADTRERAKEHNLYYLLKDQPNRWQTSYEYRQMKAAHLYLRGNAYSQIVSKNGVGVAELIPLHPDRVTPFWAPNGSIGYQYKPDQGDERIFLQDEIHHVRGLTLDGLVGLNPIQYLKETLGLTLAAQEFGSRFFGNGTNIGGVLQHPQTLGDEAYKNLKKSWLEHQGVKKSNSPVILEEGMEWKSLGIPPDQAQFLETRKFQVSEIARIFGVPPHMIADVEKSTSWGTGIEQQSIGFIVYSLMPTLTLWCQAIKRDLIAESKKRTHYAEYEVKGLMQGDSKARASFYKELWSIGSMNQNEVRKLENMEPIEGGDKYYVPLNFTDDPEKEEKEDDSRYVEIYQKAFRRELQRVVNCEVKTLRRAFKSVDGDLNKFEQRVSEFYEGHEWFVRKHLSIYCDVDQLWKRYKQESLKQMIDALKENSVESLLDEWGDSRADILYKGEAA